MIRKIFSKKKIIVTLSDMVLTDIPTRSAKVFIKAKRGRYKKETNKVPIIQNSCEWTEKLSILVKPIQLSSNKDSHPLYLSFILDENTGHSPIYGLTEIYFANLYERKVKNIVIPLKSCLYQSKFRFSISFSETDLPATDNNLENNLCEQSPDLNIAESEEKEIIPFELSLPKQISGQIDSAKLQQLEDEVDYVINLICANRDDEN